MSRGSFCSLCVYPLLDRALAPLLLLSILAGAGWKLSLTSPRFWALGALSGQSGQLISHPAPFPTVIWLPVLQAIPLLFIL